MAGRSRGPSAICEGYKGDIRYKGAMYKGTHEAIVPLRLTRYQFSPRRAGRPCALDSRVAPSQFINASSWTSGCLAPDTTSAERSKLHAATTWTRFTAS